MKMCELLEKLFPTMKSLDPNVPAENAAADEASEEA